MAQITIDIPNPVASRVADAICSRGGYTGTHNGQPETKQQFVKRWIINQLKAEVKFHEHSEAVNTAINDVNTDVETNIIIT